MSSNASNTPQDSTDLSNADPIPQEDIDHQNDYLRARYHVALGVLVAAPVLIALPPRKLDIYTVGLAGVWAVCLGEVARNHGVDTWRVGARAPAPAQAWGVDEHSEDRQRTVQGWKGEKVPREHKELEGEEGEGVGETIIKSVWDVWEQKDKRSGRGMREVEETLAERVRRIERENAERRVGSK